MDPLTVEELIEKLQLLPKDLKVLTETPKREEPVIYDFETAYDVGWVNLLGENLDFETFAVIRTDY